MKDVSNGKELLSKAKPNWYVVFVRGEHGCPEEKREYEVDRKKYTYQEYEQWKKEEVNPFDTVIHMVELVDYGNNGGNQPIGDTEPIMVPVKVKVEQLGVEEQILQKKTELCVEPVIEPQLRPYSEHIRFNEMMYHKLFL